MLRPRGPERGELVEHPPPQRLHHEAEAPPQSLPGHSLALEGASSESVENMVPQRRELVPELRRQVVPAHPGEVLQVGPGGRWQEQGVNLQLAVQLGEEVAVLVQVHAVVRGVELRQPRQVGPEPRRSRVPTLVLLGDLLEEVFYNPRQRGEIPDAEELRRHHAALLCGALGAEELRSPREHLQQVDGLLVDDLHGVVHQVGADQRGYGEDFGVVALRHSRSEEPLRVHEPHL
mmetsp:Transcript_71771/g.192623  ORF Transcript_71771/g.192623 Transcript_71771/m.192623 type:complete len:233 (-) Transcript_71771:320-1018(-)